MSEKELILLEGRGRQRAWLIVSGIVLLIAVTAIASGVFVETSDHANSATRSTLPQPDREPNVVGDPDETDGSDTNPSEGYAKEEVGPETQSQGDGLSSTNDVAAPGELGAFLSVADEEPNPAWQVSPAAVVDSWSSAKQAAAGGAKLIHLRGGIYRDVDWDVPSTFLRNVPGERVQVTGTFVAHVPDVTLAGVELSGRFEGRNDGNNATLYRTLMTGNSGVTFNGGGSHLLGRLIEVHSLHRGSDYSGNPNEWDSSDIVHVNHGASVEIDRSWLSGRTATKGLIQMIHDAGDAKLTNTYLGRGSSGSFSAHDTTRTVYMDNVYIDWWPHEVSGIGWGMRTTDVTLRNVTAFRPLFRTEWQDSYVNDITIENSKFYDIPEIKRVGTIQFTGNTHVSDRFPGNEYRATKPPTPIWQEPTWWTQLG